MTCENCETENPYGLQHHADPYEKGVCQVFTMEGAPRGWVRKRSTVDFNQSNIEGRKKLAQ